MGHTDAIWTVGKNQRVVSVFSSKECRVAVHGLFVYEGDVMREVWGWMGAECPRLPAGDGAVWHSAILNVVSRPLSKGAKQQ